MNDSPLDGIKTKQVELGWRHTDGALDTQVAAFYSWSDKSIKYDSKTLAVLQQDTKKRNYGLRARLPTGWTITGRSASTAWPSAPRKRSTAAG